MQNLDGQATPRRCLAWLVSVLGLAIAACVHAATPGSDARESGTAGELSIQLNADKLTLAVAKVPQIYLYGNMDAGAPERFDALVRAGKVPRGSDVYLNSTGGDLQAGMALGRLFRANDIATHLGVPRRTSRSPAAPREANCMGPCTLAYLGGLYRWAPTGNDRFGVLPTDPTPAPAAGIAAYLKEMDIHPEWLHPAAPQEALLTNEDLVKSGYANNGLQMPNAKYYLMGGAPYLMLGQPARDGERRITLLCKPEGLTLTAYYMVGFERARKIMARATGSYVEVDQQQILPGDRESITTNSESVVVTRPVPFAELSQFLAARSMGVWMADRGGAVRYGFRMELANLQGALKNYADSCAQAARKPAPAKS
ncbi:MAG TPA: hypothetical protein VFG49_03855 [Dyella sp.]|uniref:hypothetical protein n=1 Tax=Dyella sp. TaxID=1869338 RepID=UPI002D769AB1|nr:hypothetical protein [Dyella sp.]HET6552650.1 hypothetical protein [Dyella sp.]